MSRRHGRYASRYDRPYAEFEWNRREVTRRRFAWRAGFFGFVMLVIALLLRDAASGTWVQVALVGIGLVGGAVVIGRRPPSGSATTVLRWARRSRRNSGVASTWRLLLSASRWAMLRRAHVWRPSLADVPWWWRWRVPVHEYAVRVARVGGLAVYSPVEDVTLRVGGPRTGKSGEMADHIADAPGAVIATSTRLDLLETVGPIRMERGPVRVFNPSGLGGIASTIKFDPLTGCQVPATAYARAEDMLGDTGGGNSEREYWTTQARRVLSGLLHAAALGGASMQEVLTWVAAPESAESTVLAYLRRSPATAYLADLAQFLSTNDKTRTSITSTIMPALSWLTVEAASASADPGGEPFDVGELLASRGTVFLLGGDDGQTAPLVAALTGHIAREARRMAGLQPGGRLDPPLTLALDEAALICPVPLDQWTADMGGRGVTIHIAVQSRAQLEQRWGRAGAAAILNNAATVLVFGGTRDPDDLKAWSTLAGERVDDDLGLVPVLSAAQIAQLPERRVLIIRRATPASVGTVRMAWRRRDVRQAQRAHRRYLADRGAAETGWRFDPASHVPVAADEETSRDA
jgi:type IV secretion system protein VirD4